MCWVYDSSSATVSDPSTRVKFPSPSGLKSYSCRTGQPDRAMGQPSTNKSINDVPTPCPPSTLHRPFHTKTSVLQHTPYLVIRHRPTTSAGTTRIIKRLTQQKCQRRRRKNQRRNQNQKMSMRKINKRQEEKMTCRRMKPLKNLKIEF